jgi:UDP-N-acetylglucosamine--N-acetylmuramyl-(pentapeptide) pyrophosphoryl-undecaprenol N-acetylglucosamine transferase
MNKLRILFTGGGTGGHIYPLIAVAEKIPPEIEVRYFGPASPLNREFETRGIKVSKIASSKWRRYFSLKNFIDIPKFIFSFFQALLKILWFMPDAVFSKGGPGALAVILAARFYRIPVFIHESDAVPGLTNLFSSRFAKRIFISFKTAAQYFQAEKTILTGNPIRAGILEEITNQETAKKTLGFNPAEPVILVIGGSQGAVKINNFILDNLGEILKTVQIIHQSGPANFLEVKKESDFLLQTLGDSFKKRYYLTSYLGEIKDLKEVFAAADLIVSRAGAGAIFEIAAFGKPAILIPFEEAASDHQRMNAYEYADEARLPDGQGAAVVLEENNFKPSIFISQVQKILGDAELKRKMSEAARKFSKPDAARKIAEEIFKMV